MSKFGKALAKIQEERSVGATHPILPATNGSDRRHHLRNSCYIQGQALIFLDEERMLSR